MPEAEQNLVWNLFSSDPVRIAMAFQRLQPRLQTWSSLLNDLLGYYGLEGMDMPYTMADFERDAAERLLSKLTLSQRLQGLPPEELAAHLSPEQRMQGLSPTQMLALLPYAEIENFVTKHKAERDKNESEPPAKPS